MFQFNRPWMRKDGPGSGVVSWQRLEAYARLFGIGSGIRP